MGGACTTETPETYTLQYDDELDEPEPDLKPEPTPNRAQLMKSQSTMKSFKNSKIHPGEKGSEPATPKLERRASKLGSQVDLLKNKSLVYSKKIPWILKSGHFSCSNLSDFELGRIIGTGLMGTVRVAKLKRENAYVAIKSIKKDYIQRHNDERHVKGEKLALTSLKSSFCVKLFDTFQDSNNIYFVMEFVAGGELFRRLSKRSKFPPNTSKFYATEIFSALYHLHSLGFVYRDLKPENILLDEQGHCKLVDFGFTTRPDHTGVMHTVCGTPAYLSPEQLNGKFTNGYSRIVDWWSFGVLIYELLTGRTPFCNSNKDSNYEIYIRILNNKISFPRNFDPHSKELISLLCHPDVMKRLCDPEKIKIHPYFSMGVDWESVQKRKLIPPYIPSIKSEVLGDCHYFDEYREEPSSAVGGTGGGEGGNGAGGALMGLGQIEGF